MWNKETFGLDACKRDVTNCNHCPYACICGFRYGTFVQTRLDKYCTSVLIASGAPFKTWVSKNRWQPLMDKSYILAGSNFALGSSRFFSTLHKIILYSECSLAAAAAAADDGATNLATTFATCQYNSRCFIFSSDHCAFMPNVICFGMCCIYNVIVCAVSHKSIAFCAKRLR